MPCFMVKISWNSNFSKAKTLIKLVNVWPRMAHSAGRQRSPRLRNGGLLGWWAGPRCRPRWPLNDDKMLIKIEKNNENQWDNYGTTMITWGSPGDKLQKLWIHSHWSPIWAELFKMFQCISIVVPRVNLQKDVGSQWLPGFSTSM